MKPNYKQLRVWQKGVELAVFVYQKTAVGLISKDFGMRSQMQRCSVSISANIAEGDELGNNKQSDKFFKISKGSSGELYTLAEICKRTELLEFKDAEYIQQECLHISGMLGNLIKARKNY
jgi:four helix bundle protein